jgi:two-component system response regulator FixJ
MIVMTQDGDVATAVQAMKADAIDFVQKKLFDDQHLLDAIVAALSEPRDPSSPREAIDAAQRLAVLSRRERQILDAIVSDHPNKVIAHHLAISMRTVELHRARLGTRSMAEAIRPGRSGDSGARSGKVKPKMKGLFDDAQRRIRVRGFDRIAVDDPELPRPR